MTRRGDDHWRFARQRALPFAAAVILAAALVGCAAPDAGLQRETARQLQERVLSVGQAAADNDHAAALRALERLESDLSDASASGRVSEDRRRSIMTAVAAVRADLTAAEAEARTAAAVAVEQAKTDADAAEEATREISVPVVPAPAPAEDNKGNGGKGKGKEG